MSPWKRAALLSVAATLSTLHARSGVAEEPGDVPGAGAPATLPATAPSPMQPSAPPSLPPPGTNPASAATQMRYDVPLDLSIAIGGIALWTTLELLKPVLAVPCRWCDRDAAGNDTLNDFDKSVRNALKWDDTKTADTLSTVVSFGLAPAAGIAIGAGIAAHDHRLSEFPADLLVVAESAAIAVNINQITKYAVARERPYVHYRTPADRAKYRTPDDNLSFFSGHATLAFALSTSAGTIASMRHYRMAPAMWITGMAFATVGAYLRIAADRHYATDVLTGIAVGGGVGFSVPYFAHRPKPLPVHVAPMTLPGGAGISVSGIW
jgi:membrane-associated phospholipid phosphatase